MSPSNNDNNRITLRLADDNGQLFNLTLERPVYMVEMVLGELRRILGGRVLSYKVIRAPTQTPVQDATMDGGGERCDP